MNFILLSQLLWYFFSPVISVSVKKKESLIIKKANILSIISCLKNMLKVIIL